jgi:hypothetical protein
MKSRPIAFHIRFLPAQIDSFPTEFSKSSNGIDFDLRRYGEIEGMFARKVRVDTTNREPGFPAP